VLRLLIIVIPLGLTIYSLVDCIQTDEAKVQYIPKLLWMLLIALFSVVGSAAWLLAGRPRRSARGPNGYADGTDPVSPPKGPDDDPEFLRRLRDERGTDGTPPGDHKPE
jgi:hypothetical protein